MALSSAASLLQFLVSLQFSAGIYLFCGSNLVEASQSLAAAVCGSAACVLAVEIKAKILLLYGGFCVAGLLYDAGPWFGFFASRNKISPHGHDIALVSLLVPLTFVVGMAVSMKLYNQLSAEASSSECMPLYQADDSVDKTDVASRYHRSEEAPFKTILAGCPRG